MDNLRNSRKTRQGIVVSNKMDKTVVVAVERTIRDPHFGKVIKRKKNYYAHVEGDLLNEGQRVEIQETRPLSKLKRWRVAKVIF